MCGIAGIVSSSNENIDKDLIQKMTNLLHHRGPDGHGYYFDKGVGFGHRRLSIIDIEGGHQPMSDQDGKIWLTYNGEIYNFKELRQQLIGKGHNFKTNCDTEVIIYAYKEWGVNSFLRFNGMFSFGLWDKNTNSLYLVRDRMGVKPLYWSMVNGSILFASEIKSIIASPDVSKTPNVDALSSYLTFRQPMWDLSFFKNIEKVLPGHYILYKNSKVYINKYYELPIKESNQDLGESYYLEKLEEMLERSIKMRMISDVPLGAYLSGGLDSSLLVAMMAKQNDSKVKTFSIGYEKDEYDETKYARIVSEHCKTDHQEITISEEDYLNNWVKLIRHKSTPLSIPHEVPLYKMSIELKKDITVVLSGEGADELFAGYGRVQKSPMDWKKIKIIKSLLGRNLSQFVVQCSPKNSIFQNLGYNSHLEHFVSQYNWIPFEQKKSLLSVDVNNQLNNDNKVFSILNDIFSRTKHIDPYDRVLHFFEKIHLDCLLERLDMMSMAASVEARVPFVDDHDLISFATNIPFKHKMVWNSKIAKLKGIFYSSANASEVLDTSKYILRKTGAKYLPNSIAYRKKLGFPTPLDEWFKSGLIAYAREILLDKKTKERNLFNTKMLEKLLSNKENLPYDFYGKKIWMLMNVALWYNEVVD